MLPFPPRLGRVRSMQLFKRRGAHPTFFGEILETKPWLSDDRNGQIRSFPEVTRITDNFDAHCMLDCLAELELTWVKKFSEPLKGS